MADEPTTDQDSAPELKATMPGRNGGTLNRGGSPGRPPGSKNLTTLLREYLSENDDENAKKLVKATAIHAAKGNGVALRILWDRSDGSMKQEVDHTNNGGTFMGPTIYLPSNGRDGEPPPGGTD